MSTLLTTLKANANPARFGALLFTVAYTIAAGLYFAAEGNQEFLGYIAVIVALVLVGGVVLLYQKVPAWLMWLLAIVGLLHLLGAAVKVNGDILYNYVPFPIENPTGLTIIKFDQIVHSFASGVAALVAYCFLLRQSTFGAVGLFVLAGLASLGTGAINEVIEFTAKLTIPNTDVGGYYNTAMDLTVNTLGAVIALLLALTFWKRKDA